MIWTFPAFVTVLAFTVAIMRTESGGSDWGIGAGLGNAMRLGGALIASLFAWMIYGLAT